MWRIGVGCGVSVVCWARFGCLSEGIEDVEVQAEEFGVKIEIAFDGFVELVAGVVVVGSVVELRYVWGGDTLLRRAIRG